MIDANEAHDPSSVTAAVIGAVPSSGLDTYGKLQFIQSLWMGVDRLLTNPSVPRHVPIARMVDTGMPRSMAETVVAHVLALHRLFPQYQQQRNARVWQERYQPFAEDRVVGILGLGELGTASARALGPFGFRLIGWNRSGRDVPGVDVCTLEDTLQQSDILVNLLPLTNETQDLLCARTFSMMKAGSSIVNVARGDHIVDEDLLAALDSGRLSHAILDVFRTEPLPSNHPFWNHPKVTITPHIAAESDPRACLGVIVENLRRVAEGELPNHLVDRNRGY